VLEEHTPVIIPDVHADAPLAAAFRAKTVEDLGAIPGDIASWMGVPLMVRERTIGLLAMDNSRVDAYTTRDAELALAFATQAAVAIENARLFSEAQGKAALEERQRLARELHDSVSQALFGIGLGARTARTVIERDPAKAIAPLDYVLSLAEAGLAEMRALIFELRPEALEEEGLVAALQKQVAALKSRYSIAVDADLAEIPALSLPAQLPLQEAVYRIAQEALHNTVKHARAGHVELRVRHEDGAVRLTVVDDGKGFDTAGSFPGHLGLRTMRERAERLGGTFSMTSALGAGSRIEVAIPLR
jgi:signal transduction histidine kinase